MKLPWQKPKHTLIILSGDYIGEQVVTGLNKQFEYYDIPATALWIESGKPADAIQKITIGE